MRQQLASCLGEHHASGGAIEKAHIELLLERLDVPADGRLAQVQPFSCPCEVRGFRDCGKCA